jgi:hypothetical protein
MVFFVSCVLSFVFRRDLYFVCGILVTCVPVANVCRLVLLRGYNCLPMLRVCISIGIYLPVNLQRA